MTKKPTKKNTIDLNTAIGRIEENNVCLECDREIKS